MDVLKEVVKTLLLDNMIKYARLEECIDGEFKDRIKTQKGIDSILALVDYSDLVRYCNVAEPDVIPPIDLYNAVLYRIAFELIQTEDVKFEFKNRFMKFI
jgi:hypothetical protein